MINWIRKVLGLSPSYKASPLLVEFCGFYLMQVGEVLYGDKHRIKTRGLCSLFNYFLIQKKKSHPNLIIHQYEELANLHKMFRSLYGTAAYPFGSSEYDDCRYHKTMHKDENRLNFCRNVIGFNRNNK